jgi:hypothetical protein
VHPCGEKSGERQREHEPDGCQLTKSRPHVESPTILRLFQQAL